MDLRRMPVIASLPESRAVAELVVRGMVAFPLGRADCIGTGLFRLTHVNNPGRVMILRLGVSLEELQIVYAELVARANSEYLLI